jgi:hypothetical protein
MAVALSATSQAFQRVYKFDLLTSDEITNMMAFDTSPTSSSTTWSFSISGPGQVDWVNPFDTTGSLSKAAAIGLYGTTRNSEDIVVDAEGVVVTLNSEAAAAAENKTFEDYFGQSEQQLVDAIILSTSGQDFTIIDPGLAIVGGFLNTNEDKFVDYNLAAGRVMKFSEGTDIGSFQAVPEPATMAALGLGVAALARRRRK